MPATVDFIFDFASPNAYLAYKALPGIVERTGASFAINPCLLGGIFKATGNQAPFMAYAKIRNKLDYERLELQRFIERHGLTAFRLNPNFPVKTLILMRGAIAAQEQGILEPYVDAGLRHMWEEGLKMDEPEVFAEAMNAAGLDGDGLLERTQDPAIKENSPPIRKQRSSAASSAFRPSSSARRCSSARSGLARWKKKSSRPVRKPLK